MNKSLFLTTAACFGIPARKAGALFSELKTWEVSSGIKFVVKRMKTLKTILLGSRIVNPDSNYLLGAWGHLVSDGSISLSNRLNMLHVYLYYVASEMSEEQLDKFYQSMESADSTGTMVTPSVEGLNWLTKVCVKGRTLIPKPYLDRSRSSQKGLPRIPNWEAYQVDKTYHSHGASGATETDLSMDLAMAVDSPIWPLLTWASGFTNGFIDKRLFQLASASSSKGWTNNSKRTAHHYVGALGYIQEPGLKLRVVANPIRVGQSFLDPLKDILLDTLKQVPADCTFDQEKGIRQVQSWLKSKRVVYSVDLADATNLFPWHYQSEVMNVVLEKNKTNKDLSGADRVTAITKFMELYVKGVWATPHGDKRFTRGQPLGLGPSFPLFALSHHVLLQECGAKPGDYVILGDDICISDTQVYTEYRKKLLLLGCKVSEDKCLTSSLLAEFGGKIITSKSVTSKYKWTPIRDHNVMDVLRVFGPSVLPMVPRSLLDVVPTLCTLPRYMGGCGWIPTGIYAKMVSSVLRERLMNRTEELLPLPSTAKHIRFRTTAAQHFAKAVSTDGRLDFLSLLKGMQGFMEGVTPSGVPIPVNDLKPPQFLEEYYIPGLDREVISSNRLVKLAKQLTDRKSVV